MQRKTEVNFLSIPIKTPEKLSWTPFLLNYISTSYAEDAKMYKADCQLLDSLRQRCIQHGTTDYPFVIEDLSIYFNQLTFLGSRFPANMNLNISWYPIFSHQPRPDTINNLNYEKACVLYRLAGFYSLLGSLQSSISTEGIRKACQHFQHAAGCLKYIQTDLMHDMRAHPPADFQYLDTLITLMLTQAHECIWQKAVMEHMKHGTVARLAIKVSDGYSNLNLDPWCKLAKTKQAYFLAVAHYQKANEAISLGRYGEEIVRLRLAKTALANTQPADLSSAFTRQMEELRQSIDRDLTRAERDNDVVYMEPLPQQLAPILRSDMAKPILPGFITDPNYWLVLKDRPEDPLFIKRPLFDKLVPLAVHQAASVYSDKKNYIVDVEIVRTKNELFQEYERWMNEMQLPEALDILDALPKALVEHAEEVQHLGGLQTLNDMLRKVHNMSKRALDLIEDGFNALEEENEQDTLLDKQYGKLRDRPNLRAGIQHLLTLGTQYNDTIVAAQKADRIVQAKVANWGKAIAMLSRPTDEILQHLPHIQPEDELSEPLANLLRQMREQLELLEKNLEGRQTLEQEVLASVRTDDISGALVSRCHELTQGSPLVKLEVDQFSDVFDAYLKTYQSYQQRMQAYANEQEDVLYQLKQSYTRLGLMINDVQIFSKREKAIHNLEAAYVKVKEIRTNLVEGIKFYSNYTDLLNQFRNDCIDSTLARKMEATELSKDHNPVKMLLYKK